MWLFQSWQRNKNALERIPFLHSSKESDMRARLLATLFWPLIVTHRSLAFSRTHHGRRLRQRLLRLT